jgi:signal transduction histidine kinase/ActR/RegA family two-component response regulator
VAFRKELQEGGIERMIGYLLLTFSATVVHVLLAADVIRKNARSARNWLFAISLFSLALWAFCYTWMYAATDVETVKRWYRISAAGWIFNPILQLHFYMLLAKVSSRPVHRVVLAAGYSIAAALFLRIQFAPVMAEDFIRRDYYWEEVIIKPDVWFWLLIVYSVLAMMISGWVQFYRALKSRKRHERMQAWINTLTILLATLLIFTVNIALPVLNVRPFPSIAVVITVIPVLIVWWAYERYDTLALTPGMAADKILEKISDGIVLFNDEGRILSCNRSALHLAGSLIEAGRPVRELFIDPPSLLDQMFLPGDQFQFESTLRLEPHVPVMVEGSAFHNHAGDYIGCSLVIRDMRYVQQLRREIDERRKVQEELEQAMVELKRANEARTGFLTRVSHEIRTPMHAILGAGELLAETGLNPAQQQYLDSMRRAGETLLGLIDNLLDIARMEAGRFEIARAPFSPHALFEDVSRIMRVEAERKGLLLRLEEGNLPELLEGDEKRLRQILLNLGSNAVKFTEKGQVLLKIELQGSSEPSRLILIVEDTGIGIEPEQMERIFQPFVQGDSSITRRYGGAGLGLAIVKDLVNSMDGSIEAESQPGSFTRFKVSIPVRVLRSKEKKIEEEQPVILPPMRILVADDSPENRQIVAAFLKGQPVELTMAVDGEEAVHSFEEKHYDLILMDLQMPGIDGYTATRRIRKIEEIEQRPRTVVLAFTAHAMSDAASQAGEAGCDGVIIKPLRRRALLETILQYMAASSKNHGNDLY